MKLYETHYDVTTRLPLATASTMGSSEYLFDTEARHEVLEQSFIEHSIRFRTESIGE